MENLSPTPRQLLALRPCNRWRTRLQKLDPDVPLRASDWPDKPALVWAGVRLAPRRVLNWASDCAARVLPLYAALAPDRTGEELGFVRAAILTVRDGARPQTRLAAELARRAAFVAYETSRSATAEAGRPDRDTEDALAAESAALSASYMALAAAHATTSAAFAFSNTASGRRDQTVAALLAGVDAAVDAAVRSLGQAARTAERPRMFCHKSIRWTEEEWQLRRLQAWLSEAPPPDTIHV